MTEHPSGCLRGSATTSTSARASTPRPSPAQRRPTPTSWSPSGSAARPRPRLSRSLTLIPPPPRPSGCGGTTGSWPDAPMGARPRSCASTSPTGGAEQPGLARAHCRGLYVPRRPGQCGRHIHDRPRAVRGTCWTGEELKYVGQDGSSAPPGSRFPAAHGPADNSADAFIPGSPVTFDANDFRPADPVGPVTYTWRFQKGAAAPSLAPVSRGPFFEVMPVYGEPDPGAVAQNEWPPVRQFYARVEATDSEGRTAAQEFIVRINTVAPTVSLARDCAVLAARSPATTTRTTAGTESILFGEVCGSPPSTGWTVRSTGVTAPGRASRPVRAASRWKRSPISLEPELGASSSSTTR